MRITETAVPGAFVLTPHHIVDARGAFYESFRVESLEAAIGTPFRPEQVNFSVSAANTLRGLHGVAVPPGQAKLVTCVRGALRDMVVDLRVGSPTFGVFAGTLLEAGTGTSVYIPPGVMHGFLALTDDTCISYVLSTAHVPGTQIDINPLDPALGLPWGFTSPPLMSDKDTHAPDVATALAAGLLARWDEVSSAAQLDAAAHAEVRGLVVGDAGEHAGGHAVQRRDT
ncbi:dTDP-4-dehydrorhamnose 3,5-epimerase family protein [Catenuloplanes japonicus]|uniref:dTDP-4-dehydrorhamnose 3,5-epimerase family protein n=1 Tax=Catenuloplanes japonicus TaxID=33876 RepID=UPI0007C4BD33|nr:dTDP-4-dehydrorhamnose 3,5-epimerase family protein [Catenuloplanes japonicus]